jgi:hypothetical protein
MVSNDSLVDLKLWRTKIQRSLKIPNTGLEAPDFYKKKTSTLIFIILS